MYADDLILLMKAPLISLKINLERIFEIIKRFGMNPHNKKTKYKKELKDIFYLGIWLEKNTHLEYNFKKVEKSLETLNRLFQQNKLNNGVKITSFKALILSQLYYGLEIFDLKQIDFERIDRFINKSVTNFLQINIHSPRLIYKTEAKIDLARLKKNYCNYKKGSDFQVNTNTSGNQGYPFVATFVCNNNYLITWSSSGQDGNKDNLYAQVFRGSDNSRIGNEFQVNNYTTSTQILPTVAIFSNDRFIITWQSYGQDGDGYGVYAQVFSGSNNSRIGNEFQVNNYTSFYQNNPQVAIFSNDDFIITWHSNLQDGSGSGIYAQVFSGVDNSRIGNEFRVNSYTTNDQNNPQVAIFSNDDFIITWQSYDQDGSGSGIYAQVFNGSDNSKIGNEFQVNNYTTNDQNNPQVAIFSNDNFILTWQSDLQDGSGSGIYAQIFNGSDVSKIGNEFQANNYTTNDQNNPQVAIFSNDNFILAWQSYNGNGSDSGIYAQIFNGTNNSKIGKEFRVNNDSAYSQRNPSVAILNNDQFIITWKNQKLFSSKSLIYAQMFHSHILKIDQQIPNQLFDSQNNSINYQIPKNSFSPQDESITWCASLNNNDDLPNGLHFDSNSRILKGSVSDEDSRKNWLIKITVKDNCNNSISQNFVLNKLSPSTSPSPSPSPSSSIYPPNNIISISNILSINYILFFILILIILVH
ncbi:hypothetical protein M0812_22825 [Anaeramoeba flamelloides]|uniref:Reverse transcriptase domain-containing protein n=1 Tax=Anaeramoeba flamelloides TaxID=1746091 RepID=A0AAV7YYS0_9EUKA|nr:hypothetical protein M0812_22825 [Anaeramoeba flamelloides]